MRILITTDWYKPALNGVVVSILTLEKELIKAGHEVKILTLSQLPRSYIEGNVYYKSSVGTKIYPNVRAGLPKDPIFYDELVEWHPDVVHSNCEFFTYSLAVRVAQKCDAVLIHTYHTLYEYYLKYIVPNEKMIARALNPLLRSRLKYADHIIAPTYKTKKNLAEKGLENNVHVIPTGIDIKRFESDVDPEVLQKLRERYGIPQDAVIIGSVGRLAEEKNVQEILSFMPQALEKIPNLYALFVGNGPYVDELVKLSESLEISDRVRFPGSVPYNDVGPSYKLLDVFVSGSQSETQGLTYIEALANGCVCLCREDDALLGVIEDGKNGFIYQDEISFLVKLITGIELAQEGIMAPLALESVQKFDESHFGQAILTLYDQVVNEGHTRKVHLRSLNISRPINQIRKISKHSQWIPWLRRGDVNNDSNEYIPPGDSGIAQDGQMQFDRGPGSDQQADQQE